MKKNVLITKVKNEADIIEWFIRYHLNIFDRIVIIDNGSLDGTFEIINKIKAEGKPLIVIDEAANSFDAFRMANQYIDLAIEGVDSGFLVFMDADEFLVSGFDRFPKDELNKLNSNCVSFAKWKTYIYNNDSEGKDFSPRFYTECRVDENETFTKIIIPINLMHEHKHKLVIYEGNHDFHSEIFIEREHISTLSFAHFPIRSKEQYIKQIVLNNIQMQSEIDASSQTGSHWKKMYMENASDQDLRKLSLEYAFCKDYRTYKSVMNDMFDVDNQIKYTDLKKKMNSVLFDYTQLLAIQLKEERLKNNKLINDERDKTSIIVFGTGKKCLDRIGKLESCEKLKIVAYADSNPLKLYGNFRGKIVITPQYIRFWRFKYIVVASEYYFEEIKNVIHEMIPSVSSGCIRYIDDFLVDTYRQNFS